MNTIVKHTVGFIASIVLTLLAVFVTLYTNMTFHAKVTIIFGFAFIQAALQLLMFMHLTEGKDGRLQSFKSYLCNYHYFSNCYRNILGNARWTLFSIIKMSFPGLISIKNEFEYICSLLIHFHLICKEPET